MALVKGYDGEVVNGGTLDDVAKLIAETTSKVTTTPGPDRCGGAQEHIRGVRQSHPDLRLTIEQQIAEGEWVVSRVECAVPTRASDGGFGPPASRSRSPR
jgi:hypothetical protein